MKRLSTIGYEGAAIADFVATLVSAGVDTLVDVRELPLSRRKGFSKTALAATLEREGIAYRHFRDLGDPKPGRDAARAGRMSEFRKIYARHMKTSEAKAALEQVSEIVASNNACLLCYEREPNHCHRAMIADALANGGLIRVVHLGVKAGHDRDVRSGHRQRAGNGSREGLAATK